VQLQWLSARIAWPFLPFENQMIWAIAGKVSP
jgi:hypothetical protein